jgi:hypothetical protein
LTDPALALISDANTTDHDVISLSLHLRLCTSSGFRVPSPPQLAFLTVPKVFFSNIDTASAEILSTIPVNHNVCDVTTSLGHSEASAAIFAGGPAPLMEALILADHLFTSVMTRPKCTTS